jgi:acetyl-CoA carboxylase biotin carboxyl carrier protein
MALDVETIVRLIDAVTERGITHFEVESDGTRLRIERRPVPDAATAPVVIQAQPPLAASAAGKPVEAPKPRPATEDDPSLHTLTSPMVGTFYSAPSPTAEPYVRVGDRVKKGQVLCIVEAMKLMNEIESDITGTVEAVLVENAQPVEYGEALFRVRVD